MSSTTWSEALLYGLLGAGLWTLTTASFVWLGSPGVEAGVLGYVCVAVVIGVIDVVEGPG